MKELPEELTPELLSLVLGEEVVKIDGVGNGIHPSETTLCYREDDIYGGFETSINLDTLIKLMKNWCREQGYSIQEITSFQDLVEVGKIGKGWGKTFVRDRANMLIIKAMHHVAKEKGLIDEV